METRRTADGPRHGDRLVVISGCSGGGKSTLLGELARRGYRTIEEPGRRVVRSETAGGGDGLPWKDPVGFATLCFELALRDHADAATSGELTFFDRSSIDAYSALEAAGFPRTEELRNAIARARYARTVFLAPPWASIHQNDAERRHSFDEAVEEYERLTRCYPSLGYRATEIPRTDVAARADFVLERLDGDHRVTEPLRRSPPART